MITQHRSAVYILLPLIMLCLTNKWGRFIVAALLLIWIGIRVHHPEWSSVYTSFGRSILGRLTAFIAGGILSWTYQLEVGQRWLRKPLLADTIFFVSGAALLILLTYRCIETPFLKLKSHLPTRKAKSLAVGDAAAQ